MTSSLDALSACVSPASTARVFNPIRPEYYRKDVASTAAPQSDAAVRITLSAEAQAAMKGN